MRGPLAVGMSKRALAATLLAAAGYAGLSAGLALDREAATNPALARLVPEPLRQQVLASQGQALVKAGRPHGLTPLAETLLRRDPLAPQAAGLLGVARLAEGNALGAASAFRTSAKLGWRDASTQVYWLQMAVAAGDMPRASTRFSAIVRQWPEAPAIDQLSIQFESAPRGQMLIARQIADGAKWARTYAQPQARQPLDRLARRAAVLIAAAGLGSELGCDAVGPMVVRLAQAQPILANRLWTSQCPRAAAPGLINDPGFEQAVQASGQTPFDWQFPGNGALQAGVIRNRTGSSALRAKSTAAILVPLAMQRIVIAPGNYTLSWREVDGGNQTTARIAGSLSCRPERVLAEPRTGSAADGSGRLALAYGGGCEAPLLQLWLTPGPGEVIIDDVALTRR